MFGFPNTGGTLPGTVASVDSIESVGTKLTTIDASSFSDGDLIYVGNETFAGQGSIKAYVRVRRGASLTPTEGMVWDSATTGVQFERLDEASSFYLQKFVWFVTSNDSLGTAIIDNDGQSSNHPVSMREINRRRASDSEGIVSQITVVFPEDMTSPARLELEACMLSNWRASDANGRAILVGLPTVAFTGTISSFAPAVPGSNTGYILGCPTIGTTATIGQPLRHNEGDDNNVIHAVVAEIIDVDHVRCSQPRTGSAANYNAGAPAPFVVGTAIELLTGIDLPIWPFIPEQLQSPSAQHLNFVNFSAQNNIGRLGNSNPILVSCTMDSITWSGGGAAGALVACGAINDVTLSAPNGLRILSCEFGPANSEATVGHLNVVGGFVSAGDDNDFTSCALSLSAGARWNMDAGTPAMSLFGMDSAANVALVDRPTSFNATTGPVYGGDNTGRLFDLAAGTFVRVAKATLTAVTSAAHSLLIEDGLGGDYDVADISIVNPLGGGIIDPTSTDTLPLALRTDARSFAGARAIKLGVFPSAPTAFEDAFTAPPGTSPSQWLNPILSAGTTAQLPGERGGVVRISSAGTLNAVEAWNLGPATGALPGLINDPGASGSRWYLLWIFRVPTVVDNHTSATINIRGAGPGAPGNELFFGVDGAFASTVVLMGEENLVSITLSSIAIAPGTWHYLEAYQRGVANEVRFRFDGEAEKTLTLTAPFGVDATLAIETSNGATLTPKSLDTDHIVLLMDNNVVLASV